MAKKSIDIRTMKKVDGGASQQQAQPKMLVGIPPNATNDFSGKTFIIRFAEVMIYDIKRKLGLVKAPVTDDEMKWEDYERFCRLVRGER